MGPGWGDRARARMLAAHRRRVTEGDNDMGQHEDKDKADDQRKVESNGHKPGRDIPPEDPGGKHGTSDKDDKTK
jgi:hypothetical protein